MTISEMLQDAQTGDVILVEGNGFISKFIRLATASQFSHVALVCEHNGNVFLREFVEGTGFKFWPSILRWFDARKGQTLYFGKAPEMDRKAVLDASVNYPFSDSYGYLSLFKVWISQLIGKKIKTRQKVCSTYVQHTWQAGGIEFIETADPGDYMNLCTSIHRLEYK